MIHHFIIQDLNLYIDKNVRLSRYETRHLAGSLRIKTGEFVNLVNGDGYLYKARITNINDTAELSIISIDRGIKQKENKINALVPLIKKNRFEIMLEKLTEAGIDDIYSYYSDYGSISKVSMKDRYIDRWNSIILSSVKQCKRASFPVFHKPQDLDVLLNEIQFSNGMKIFLDINGKREKPVFLKKDIFFIIGPEGGFSQQERNLLISCDFLPLKFADYQLRTETAAVIFCGIINYFRRNE